MAFFARYVISVAFIGLGFELLRLPELLLLSLKLCCARSDAEKSSIEKVGVFALLLLLSFFLSLSCGLANAPFVYKS